VRKLASGTVAPGRTVSWLPVCVVLPHLSASAGTPQSFSMHMPNT